jgi:predicted site-specific integrase-resolvase
MAESISLKPLRIGHCQVPAKRASKTTKSERVFGQPQKAAKMFRVGLYARVSTHDQQTLPLQVRAMREYATKRGWTIAAQIKEVGSGAAERELREKLMAAARRREIDVVLVWRLDRWGRSLVDLLITLKELSALGVGFVSLTEALDLTTPTGREMAALLSVFADNAECAIMQSHGNELAPWPTHQGRETPHNTR